MRSVLRHAMALSIASLLLAAVPSPAGAGAADPRWRFFTSDRTFYHSPWYAGAHRIMIPFGCTRAPYYSPDPRCAQRRGFQHGFDIVIGHTRRVSVRPGDRVRARHAAGPGLRLGRTGRLPPALREAGARGWSGQRDPPTQDAEAAPEVVSGVRDNRRRGGLPDV